MDLKRWIRSVKRQQRDCCAFYGRWKGNKNLQVPKRGRGLRTLTRGRGLRTLTRGRAAHAETCAELYRDTPYTVHTFILTNVGHPFEHTHPQNSRALRRYLWYRVLGQRIDTCSLRDTTPSQCLITNVLALGIPLGCLQLQYSEGQESADHIAKRVAGSSEPRNSEYQALGVRKERASPMGDVVSLSVSLMCLYNDAPVCGNESKECQKEARSRKDLEVEQWQ